MFLRMRHRQAMSDGLITYNGFLVGKYSDWKWKERKKDILGF